MVFAALYRMLTRPGSLGKPSRVKGSRPGRRSALFCESLEDRVLLSTYTVVDLGDAGAGSDLSGDLRYCLTQANTNGEASNQIVFDSSLAGTITLTQGVLAITKDVQLAGPGASGLT